MTQLTIEELITVTSNNLETAVASETFLQFVPDTPAVLATVAQLNDDGQWRRARTARIIGAKPTTPNHLDAP